MQILLSGFTIYPTDGYIHLKKLAMKIKIQQSVLGGIIGTAVMTLTMLPAPMIDLPLIISKLIIN